MIEDGGELPLQTGATGAWPRRRSYRLDHSRGDLTRHENGAQAHDNPRVDGTEGRARQLGKPRHLRNVVTVAVGVILPLAGGIWLSWPAPLGLVLDCAGLSSLPQNPPLPEKPSVVVLPFANLSDDPEQE